MGFGVTRSALPAVVVAACMAFIPTAAFAAPHPPTEKPAAPTDKSRAADLFKKSADAYLHGDFAQAIKLLDEAYALDPQPVLVYNMARAHEGLGHIDEAITLYERYLAQEPSSPDRGAIEQRLATLKRQRDEHAAVEKERAAVEKDRAAMEKERAKQALVVVPPPEPPPPHHRSVLPYVVAGVGVVGLVTGTIFGLAAKSKEDDAKNERVQSTAIDLRDSGKTSATISNVAFIAGGALVAAGVVWWVLDTPRTQTTGAAPLRVGLGPGFVGLAGGFR